MRISYWSSDVCASDLARVQAWPPPQRARAGLSSLGSSPFRGRGMEFAETRMYTRGDDVRHVDWRVTARTGTLHTKVFHAERERITQIGRASCREKWIKSG